MKKLIISTLCMLLTHGLYAGEAGSAENPFASQMRQLKQPKQTVGGRGSKMRVRRLGQKRPRPPLLAPLTDREPKAMVKAKPVTVDPRITSKIAYIKELLTAIAKFDALHMVAEEDTLAAIEAHPITLAKESRICLPFLDTKIDRLTNVYLEAKQPQVGFGEAEGGAPKEEVLEFEMDPNQMFEMHGFFREDGLGRPQPHSLKPWTERLP